MESKKEEISDGHLGAGGIPLVNANDDVAAFQDLLGVLQEGHEGLFRAAVGHLVGPDVDVQSAQPQDGVPPVAGVALDAEAKPQGGLGVQSLAHRVRGIP